MARWGEDVTRRALLHYFFTIYITSNMWGKCRVGCIIQCCNSTCVTRALKQDHWPTDTPSVFAGEIVGTLYRSVLASGFAQLDSYPFTGGEWDGVEANETSAHGNIDNAPSHRHSHRHRPVVMDFLDKKPTRRSVASLESDERCCKQSRGIWIREATRRHGQESFHPCHASILSKTSPTQG